MTRKYSFIYKEGKYILQYSNPNATDAPFEINADSMYFDLKNFYLYIFSDVKEKMDIEIKNDIQSDGLEPEVLKKGERVYTVIADLCKEITCRINKECFGEVSDN